MTVLSVLLPALFAGLAAILVTVAVERLGGLMGGVLGTLPTTIVPGAIGIFLGAELASFELAMFAVAPGMFLNALFLLVWGVLPGRLAGRGLRVQLIVTLVVSLALWFAGALGLALLLQGRATLTLALVMSLALALIGLLATARTRATPRARRRVSALALLSRGGAAALAIGAAVAVAAAGGDVVAGIVSVFPAIFLTTMVSLWISHGAGVPSGAVGPMMVGSTSVAAYALVASWALPRFGPTGGAALTWVFVALAVQLPLFFMARALVGRLAR